MIFPLSVNCTLFMPAILDHVDRPHLSKLFASCVNEYGHFEKLQSRKINYCDRTYTVYHDNLSIKVVVIRQLKWPVFCYYLI